MSASRATSDLYNAFRPGPSRNRPPSSGQRREGRQDLHAQGVSFTPRRCFEVWRIGSNWRWVSHGPSKLTGETCTMRTPACRRAPPGRPERGQGGRDSTGMDLGARRVASLAAVAFVFLSLVAAVRAEDQETEPQDEPKLLVDYEPPLLSVEAHEVGLGEVLKAIGDKVGFIVLETAPSSTVVTVSIQSASLDDVLRQLLRAENHTVLYRAGGGMSAESGAIDRIVLLGDPGEATAAATPAEGPAQERPQPAQDHRDAHPETASPSPPPPSPESPPVLPDGARAPADSSEPATLPLSVADILKAH